MSAVLALTQQLAGHLNIPFSEDLLGVLKATAFKGDITDAKMAALLVVANQYQLNPWTKEIYAYPDRSNGIVPVVGVDGWARIINSHEDMDGIEFVMTDGACECKIYRKSRSHATSVIEYDSECNRKIGPWLSHPKRMLRHKAMIQCARIAFGFAGIYDEDEAARISEANKAKPLPNTVGEAAEIDPAIVDALQQAGESAAQLGMESFKQWFTALDRNSRVIANSFKDDLKSVAQAFDEKNRADNLAADAAIAAQDSGGQNA